MFTLNKNAEITNGYADHDSALAIGTINGKPLIEVWTKCKAKQMKPKV